MVFLCQVSVSVSGNLVKDTTVRNWELFETGNTVNEKKKWVSNVLYGTGVYLAISSG